MVDALDVISLADAKRAINMSTTNVDHEDTLARHITTVSRIIDDMCGPVVRRTVTAEMLDGGSAIVALRRRPVTSVTTVREARAGTVETLAAVAFGGTGDGYMAPNWERDPSLLSGILRRRRSGCDYVWRSGSNAVEVTYVAGRVANTTDVDERFVDAAGAILRRFWKREAGTWAQTPVFFESADTGADDAIGSGFFRVAKPIIEELLHDEVQHMFGIA